MKQNANVVFISATGMGKNHLMTALGHAACQRGHSVLCTSAIEIINTLCRRTGQRQYQARHAPLHQA